MAVVKLDGSETGFVKALSVLNEAGGDVTEEKLEQVFAGVDLSYLLQKNGVAGTAARIINSIHPDARLVALSSLAAYIDHRRDINPALKFVLVAALRAAPQSITAMLAAKQPVDEKSLATAMDGVVKKVEVRELYVGPKRTDLIHDQAIHPADQGSVVNRGTLGDILSRFEHNVLCPDCFGKELASGRIKVEVKPPPPGPARAFLHLAGFTDQVKRKFIQGLYMLADAEIRGDQGFGLEGRAGHIVAALTLALDTAEGAKGLEAIAPSNQTVANELFRLSELTPEMAEAERTTNKVILPLVARRFVADLLLAYQVSHPISHTEVRARDWGDALWSRAPASLRPKRAGLAGVWEVASKPFGLIFLALVAILLMLIVIVATMLIVPMLWLVGIILGGLFKAPELFQPGMTGGMFAILKSTFLAWLVLVLVPIVGTVTERFKPFQPRVQTLRIVVAAVGLGLSLRGWGTDWFTDTGVALFVTAVWTVLLAVEFSNKFGVKMTPAFVTKGMERSVTAITVIGVVLLALGTVYTLSVSDKDADRVTALGAGVVNSTVDAVAGVVGVSLSPSEERCRQGLAALKIEATKANMTVARICELGVGKFPCTCR